MIVIMNVFQSLYEYNNVIPLDADGDGGGIGDGVVTVGVQLKVGYFGFVGMILRIVGIDDSALLTDLGFNG